MAARSTSESVFVFGPFRLDLTERLLLRDGEPIGLRAKIFDTLAVLVRRAGRLVERQELLDAVWPDSIVEEGNLSHNISALRKALADGCGGRYIETVPKRGYRFVHEVGQEAAASGENDGLLRARRVFEQGAWAEAYELFRALETAGLGAADRGRLAEAARWSGRHDEVVPLLEATAEAHRREGDTGAAARTALDLATVLLDRGRPALAASYVRQAERALAGTGGSEGERARRARLLGRLDWLEGKWERALARSGEAVELSRQQGDRDTEAMALVDGAHSLIALQRFDEAAGQLDEAGAAVTSGSVGPYAAGLTMCGLICGWRACGRAARAAEWVDASIRWVDEAGVAYFPGLCRVHRGELCSLRGDLAKAEADLASGADELAAADSALAGMGLRELGLVRLRRGDLAGAEQAFGGALEYGFEPQPGLALLRVARGEPELARRDLERFLAEGDDAPHNILDRENRAAALAALATIGVATGALEPARRAAGELERMAAVTGSAEHRAAADGAAGEIALHEGRVGEAVVLLRRSWRSWTEVAAPHEAASARAALGEALLAEGDTTRAAMELEGAAATFERLGVRLEAGRVRRRLDELAQPAGRSPRVVACGQIADRERLRATIGESGWRDLDRWLERKLQACWAEHGGRALAAGPDSYGVSFGDLRSCLRCVAHLQRSLREHRAAQGFAPALRLGVVAAGAGPQGHREQDLLALAQHAAELAGPGQLAIVGGDGDTRGRPVNVPGTDLTANIVAAGEAGDRTLDR